MLAFIDISVQPLLDDKKQYENGICVLRSFDVWEI